MRTATAAAVWSLGLLLAACANGSSSGAAIGDCSPSIGFQGVVYVFNTAIDQSAPRGTALGSGSALDCDQQTVLEPAEIIEVKGVDSRQAIRVILGPYHGVYVAEDLPEAQWPSAVRAR